MQFYRYFEIFLNIEDTLADYISQLEFSSKSKNIYSPKISLLLLQTCPIIESYMVQLCTTSNTVKKHPLYNWDYNWKLWESDEKKPSTSKEKEALKTSLNFLML